MHNNIVRVLSNMSLTEEVSLLDKSGRWNATFQMLNLETRKQRGTLDTNIAKMPENRNRNRYRDVLPYDNSRIVLKFSEEGDYINASLVEVPLVNRKYILTQGPLPHTCADFWRMIWEQQSTVVVMLNKIIEKNTIKCHPYWPRKEEEDIEFDEFKVTTRSENKTTSYITRDFLLENTNSGESRTVKHFHYVLWPDFGVPKDPLSFLLFLKEVRQSCAFSKSVAPPIIHCSAGIGRSGTFCLVDSALALAEKRNTADGLNLTSMLLGMRRYRFGLIQTSEQLRFAYLAVIEGLSKLFPAPLVSKEGSETKPNSSTSNIGLKDKLNSLSYQSHSHKYEYGLANQSRVDKDVKNEKIRIEHQKNWHVELITSNSSNQSIASKAYGSTDEPSHRGVKRPSQTDDSMDNTKKICQKSTRPNA